MAAPVPHQLVAVASEEQDDRRGIDRPAAAVADRSPGVRVHGLAIGTEALALQLCSPEHPITGIAHHASRLRGLLLVSIIVARARSF